MKFLSLLLRAALLFVLAAPMSLPAQSVEQWQAAAVQKHPALAQAGSPLNQRFLAFIAEQRKSNPGFFVKADWPMRAADMAAAALQQEQAAKPKTEPAPTAPADPAMPPDEAAWEKDKARWVFDRLMWGDTEEVVMRKLYLSKLITARAPPQSRVELNSRFSWVLGERKFVASFELKPALAAISFDCLPERTSELDSLVREDFDKLRAAAVEKFGQPTRSPGYPEVRKLVRGGFTETDAWDTPNAKIKLGITESDGKCNPTLRISDPARGE